MKTIAEIEGTKPDKFIQADVGNGYANYALHDGRWFSTNGGAQETIQVRWECRETERNQIVAILQSRLNRYGSY